MIYQTLSESSQRSDQLGLDGVANFAINALDGDNGGEPDGMGFQMGNGTLDALPPFGDASVEDIVTRLGIFVPSSHNEQTWLPLSIPPAPELATGSYHAGRLDGDLSSSPHVPEPPVDTSTHAATNITSVATERGIPTDPVVPNSSLGDVNTGLAVGQAHEHTGDSLESSSSAEGYIARDGSSFPVSFPLLPFTTRTTSSFIHNKNNYLLHSQQQPLLPSFIPNNSS